MERADDLVRAFLYLSVPLRSRGTFYTQPGRGNRMSISDCSSLLIVPIASEDQIEAVRGLLLEYWCSRGLSLTVFNFDRELAELPGEYAPPSGRLWLASYNGEPVGCVALRQLQPYICEMKRLYLGHQVRGRGFGRQLAEAAISEARLIGYKKMRLDTILPGMQEAVALYLQLGFTEIAPYRNNPLEGARYLELEL